MEMWNHSLKHDKKKISDLYYVRNSMENLDLNQSAYFI